MSAPHDLRVALESIAGVASVAAVDRRSGGLPPAYRVRPGSAPEVAALVSLAAARGARVVAVGNGTSGPPALDDARPLVLCDLGRMNHVLHLDEGSLTVQVQSGLSGLLLESVLQPRDLTLGDFPPAVLTSTIGGLLAVRTPGKASARSGALEDAVLGVSAVLADGRTVHTRVAPRRATGPDLARLLLGSAGTIGILTAATLRIHRRPEARLLAAYLLPGIAEAIAAVRLALHEEAAPAAVRVYDAAEAADHLGEDVAPRGQAVLVVATAGPTDLAACDRDLFASAVSASGGAPTADEVAHRWWRLRTGHDRRELPRPDLQVAASPRRQLPVHAAVTDAARAAGAAARCHASRFAGDGCVFFFTLRDGEGGPLSTSKAAVVRKATADAARAAGGDLLGALPADAAALWDALRATFDPHHVFADRPRPT